MLKPHGSKEVPWRCVREMSFAMEGIPRQGKKGMVKSLVRGSENLLVRPCGKYLVMNREVLVTFIHTFSSKNAPHPTGMAELTNPSFGRARVVEIEGMYFDERATLVCRRGSGTALPNAETGHGHDIRNTHKRELGKEAGYRWRGWCSRGLGKFERLGRADLRETDSG